ncbi:acyltransferase family-domain-containing protein [Nemania sp. NC0429]|nr:acyltransferase family-domain-containing protein [Nemania sp. NC0429]
MLTFSGILERLGLREADEAGNSANYYLLSENVEKGDDAEGSASDVELGGRSIEPGGRSIESGGRSIEPGRRSIETRPLSKKPSGWRWLQILLVLVPSFIYSSTSPEPKRLRPTAWLDGLRGVASLMVVCHHASLIWFSWDLQNGWRGWNDHLIDLPIIRLVITGRANVMLFFAISGYALSYKPLTLLYKGQHLKMYEAVASSVCRRHPRLFIPAVIMCTPALVIAYCGGYPGGESAAIGPMSPPRQETFLGQIWHYMTASTVLVDVYTGNGHWWPYSASLWTLPIEFTCSLQIFIMLLGLSRFTAPVRILITIGFAFYSWWWFFWSQLLFIGGMLVADISIWLRQQPEEGERRPGRVRGRWRRLQLPAVLKGRVARRVGGVAAFMAALHVLSMPDYGRGAPESWGYGLLAALIPPNFRAKAIDDFWEPMGAIFVVFVVDQVRFLQGIFTTRFTQYLGRISFSLYLVHMMLLHSLGLYLSNYFKQFTGSETYWQYGVAVGLAALITGSVILWLADVGARLVDANAVRFSAWAYGKLCKPSEAD